MKKVQGVIYWLILQDGYEKPSQVVFNFDLCRASEADDVMFVTTKCKQNTIEAEIRLTDKHSNLSIRCSSLDGNDGSLYIHIEGEIRKSKFLNLKFEYWTPKRKETNKTRNVIYK